MLNAEKNKKHVHGLTLLLVIALSGGNILAAPAGGRPQNHDRQGWKTPANPQQSFRMEQPARQSRGVVVNTQPKHNPVQPVNHFRNHTPQIVKPAPVAAPRNIMQLPARKPVIVQHPIKIQSPPRAVIRPSNYNVTLWFTNNSGLRLSVILTRSINGTGYHGPRGEYYSCLPTSQQLNFLYGTTTVIKEPATVTVWISNDNGSQTPVVLTKSGSGFTGPSGEYYSCLPTEQQLRAVYGLKLAETQAPRETAVVWIQNSDGSQTSVTLTVDGENYVGPSGEYYAGLPTEQQLKAVYGS